MWNGFLELLFSQCYLYSVFVCRVLGDLDWWLLGWEEGAFAIGRESFRYLPRTVMAVLMNREILIKEEIEDLLELGRTFPLALGSDGSDAKLMRHRPRVDLGDQLCSKLKKSEKLSMREDLRSIGTLESFSEIGLEKDLGQIGSRYDSVERHLPSHKQFEQLKQERPD